MGLGFAWLRSLNFALWCTIYVVLVGRRAGITTGSIGLWSRMHSVLGLVRVEECIAYVVLYGRAIVACQSLTVLPVKPFIVILK